MITMEIDRLLRQISLGDNSAFEQLYIKTKKGVFAFLYTYFNHYEDTEDAMQMVYLKIKRGISSYKGGNGRAWMLEIAKNHALNELRRKRETLSEEALKFVPDKEVNYFDSSGIFGVMKKCLTAEEEQIVILHVLWGYKHREVALLLNAPTGTITSKYKRAVQKIKENLKEEGKWKTGKNN